MHNKITSLEDLEQAQEKLKMTMKLTREEFAQSIGTNRKQLKSFIVKNVAIPAGAISLGAMAYQQISGSNGKKVHRKKSSSMLLLGKLLPLALNVAQTFFLKKQNKKINASTQANDQPQT